MCKYLVAKNADATEVDQQPIWVHFWTVQSSIVAAGGTQRLPKFFGDLLSCTEHPKNIPLCRHSCVDRAYDIQSSSCANRHCSYSGVGNPSYSFGELHGDFSYTDNPLRVAHETIGYVEEVGDSVGKLETGEWFVISFALDDSHYQDGRSVDAPLTSEAVIEGNLISFFCINVDYPPKPCLSTAVSASHTRRL